MVGYNPARAVTNEQGRTISGGLDIWTKTVFE